MEVISAQEDPTGNALIVVTDRGITRVVPKDPANLVYQQVTQKVEEGSIEVDPPVYDLSQPEDPPSDEED